MMKVKYMKNIHSWSFIIHACVGGKVMDVIEIKY